ncbi:MAG: hypothetical protein IJX65_04440 [Alistipes sp.]|nr:hypothetical protein [Alistipes sp.]
MFRTASALLATILLFASCGNDPTPTPEDPNNPDDKPQVESPAFPEAVTDNVVAGSEYTLTIEPNMAWEVSVPEATAAYFQLRSGDNLVYKLRGDKGTHEITVVVANVEEFDADHICEVTMTMQGESRTIATLTLSHKEREMKIYSVVVEDNAFSYATEGEQTYAYQSTECPAEGMKMIWPQEMALYSTRVKVVSNFDWIVDGTPEWIVPIEGGKAGTTELWIKGNSAKYPMTEQSAVLSFVDAVATDKSVGQLKVTIPAATEIFTVEGFSATTQFNYQGLVYSSMVGEYVEGGVNGSVTAVNGSAVAVVEFTEAAGLVQPTLAPEWLTAEYAAWDSANEDVIQRRTLSLSAVQNEGAPRRAVVLVMPQSVATNDIDVIAVNDQISPDYQQYVVTTVEQAGNPGSIEIVGEQAMEAAGSNIDQLEGSHWIFSEFAGTTVGYDVLYTSEWAHEDWYVNVVRPYTAIKCYSFDANGSLVEISGSTAWITTTVFGTNNEKVRIQMDTTKSTAAAAKNAMTGDYEGVVTFVDESGVFALLFCRYNESAAQGTEGVAFGYPDYAAQQGSTLEELTSGDLYIKYASYGEKVYHLTYTTATPNLSMLNGLPQEWSYVDSADESWLKYEYSEEYQVVTMNANTGNGKTGALVFGQGELVLICTLNIAQ